VPELRLLEDAHAAGLRLHTRVVTEFSADAVATAVLAGYRGRVTYLFQKVAGGTADGTVAGGDGAVAMDFFSAGLGLHPVPVTADTAAPRALVVNLGFEGPSSMVERVRHIVPLGGPADWVHAKAIFAADLHKKMGDVLQRVAMDGPHAWAAVKAARAALGRAAWGTEISAARAQATAASMGGVGWGAGAPPPRLAALVDDHTRALLRAWCHQQRQAWAGEDERQRPPPCRGVAAPAPPPAGEGDGVRRAAFSADWSTLASLFLPPAAADYNTILAHVLAALESHARAAAAAAAAAATAVGAGSSCPPLADHCPVCPFVLANLMLFSVDGLLPRAELNVTRLAALEGAFGLTRHVDAGAFAPSLLSPPSPPAPPAETTTAEEAAAAAAAMWPEAARLLLELRRVTDTAAAGRWEPLALLRDACRLLRVVPSCPATAAAAAAALPVAVFTMAYLQPDCRDDGLVAPFARTARGDPAARGGDALGDATVADFRRAVQRRRMQLARGEVLAPACGPPGAAWGADLVERFPAHLQGRPCEPWVDRGAIYVLDLVLRPHMRGLEWGAGSSSHWLLERLGHLVSVEHSEPFFRALGAAARAAWPAALLGRWTLEHRPHEPGLDVVGGDAAIVPAFTSTYLSPTHGGGGGGGGDGTGTGTGPGGRIPYVDDPLDARNGTFDFIFIDGMARGAALARAVRRLRPHGGILVLDNSNRLEYRRALQEHVPCHWLKYAENNVATMEVETTIFVSRVVAND